MIKENFSAKAMQNSGNLLCGKKRLLLESDCESELNYFAKQDSSSEKPIEKISDRNPRLVNISSQSFPNISAKAKQTRYFFGELFGFEQ